MSILSPFQICYQHTQETDVISGGAQGTVAAITYPAAEMASLVAVVEDYAAPFPANIAEIWLRPYRKKLKVLDVIGFEERAALGVLSRLPIDDALPSCLLRGFCDFSSVCRAPFTHVGTGFCALLCQVLLMVGAPIGVLLRAITLRIIMQFSHRFTPVVALVRDGSSVATAAAVPLIAWSAG